jgi:hypothetical protein
MPTLIKILLLFCCTALCLIVECNGLDSRESDIYTSREKGIDSASSLAIDDAENIYLSYVLYDEGKINSLGSTDSSKSYSCIVKLDKQWNFKWRRYFNDITKPYLAVDSENNVYIVGHLLDGNDLFASYIKIVKIDTNSNVMWSKLLDTSHTGRISSAEVDGVDNLLLVCQRLGEQIGSNSDVNYCDSRSELIQVNEDGSEIFMMASYDNVLVNDIVFSDDTVYVCGINTMPINGLYDSEAFISRNDRNFNPIWTHSLQYSNKTNAHAIDIDNIGNIYVGGTYSGSIATEEQGDIDDVTGKTKVGAFLIALKPDGKELYSFSWRSEAGLYVEDLIVTDFNEVLIKGKYIRNILFGPLYDGSVSMNSGVNSYVVVVSAENEVNNLLLWNETDSNEMYSWFNDRESIIIDKAQNIMVCGTMEERKFMNLNGNEITVNIVDKYDSYVLSMPRGTYIKE